MKHKHLSTALADSILARFPDPDEIPYRRWCYVQGYVLCGLEKLYHLTGDARYWDYVQRFVDQHVTAEGNVRDFKGDSLDDIMAGTVIVAVYEQTGQEKYRLAAEKIKAAFDDYPRNSDGGFWHARRLAGEMWIDGVFMGGMFLTRYGAVVGDQASCFDEVTRQILALAGHCRKGETGLFLHAYDERRNAAWADPVTGLSPEVWSEGLGWYALILVESLALMPVTHPGRAAVMGILSELIEGLLKVQDQQTGLWYQVVDKGDRADNWHDSSGSAMFVYCIQRAIGQSVNRSRFSSQYESDHKRVNVDLEAHRQGRKKLVEGIFPQRPQHQSRPGDLQDAEASLRSELSLAQTQCLCSQKAAIRQTILLNI